MHANIHSMVTSCGALGTKKIPRGMRNHCFQLKIVVLGLAGLLFAFSVCWGSFFESPTLDPLAPAQSKRSLYARVAS